MQARGGFVQYVKGAARVAFGQFQRQFDALRFTARQGGGALAQADVGQAHVEQRLQFAGDVGHGAEELVCYFHRHVQDLRDVLTLVLHFQRFAVVAHAVAHVTRHVHVGQKVHLHFDHAVALAGLAAPPGHVEAEAPGAIAALACRRHFGHQFADVGEQSGVGGGVAARRAANGRLVDVDDLVKVLQPFDFFVGGGFIVCPVNLVCRCGVQRVVDQRGFARAGYAGHTGQQAHGEFDVHVFQVVARCAHDLDEVLACFVAFGDLDFFTARHVLASDRIGRSQNVGASALSHHAPAVHARARPHVNHMVGHADHVFVVLDHQHAVADVAQVLQRADQAVVVALMQANAGFIQHIHHARQARADLAGQSDALRLAARQRFGAAVQAQIVQAHVVQELQTQGDFAHHFVGNLGLGPVHLQALKILL